MFLKDAESMMVVPYHYNTMTLSYILGGNVYDISSIIGDTITIEQSDEDAVTKKNEFTKIPVLENGFCGKYDFTAQCLDLQNNVLKSCFFAFVGENNNGSKPAAFKQDMGILYALIRIRFKDESLPDVFLPKVKLDSKAFVNQLKTRASQGNIVGTAFPTKVAVDYQSNTLCPFGDEAQNSTFAPYTPLVFVPRDKTPFFYSYSYSSTQDKYRKVDFSNGYVSDVLVTESTGIWS